MSIRQKVNVILLVIILMMSSISLGIHYVLTCDIRTYDQILANILAANKLPGVVQEVYQYIKRYQSLPSQELRSRIENTLRTAGELVQTVQKNTPPGHTDSLRTIENMAKVIDSITVETTAVMQLINRHEVSETLLDSIELLDRAVGLSRDNMDVYLTQELEHTVYLRKEIVKKNERLRTALFVGMPAFSLVALLVGMLFANRWVVFPLRHIVAGVRSIASGELDMSVVPQGGNDEIGELASDIDRMRASIKEMTEDLKEQERQKRILAQIANVFLVVPDEQMFGEVLSVVLQEMKSKYGIFGFIEENGDLVIPSLTREIWDECRVPGKSIIFPPDTWRGSLWGRAIREQKALFSDGPFHTPVGHVHVESFLSVPIIFGNDTIGLFSVANKEDGYTEEDRDWLEGIAGYTSPILNARLQRDRKEREREEAQKALRASEERYRMLFENATEGIFLTTPAGRYVSVNPSTASMFRYSSPQDMIDSVTDIGQQIYANPEDRLTVKRMLAEHGRFEDFEVEMVRKDKTRIWVSMNIHVRRDEQGNIMYYDGTCVDITESKRAAELLRESEERLRLTLAAAHIGIFDWDIEHDVWYASPDYYTMLGYEPSDAMGDQREWLERMHPDDLPHVSEKIQAMLDRGDSADQAQAFEYEARLRHADGTYRWQHVKGFGVKYDPAGRMTRMLGIRMDINERKTAEEALRQLNLELDQRVAERTSQLAAAKDQAEKANRAKSVFLASMSHELRTPLNAVLGFSQLMKNSPGVTLELMESLDIITRSGEHLLNLINNVLDISKIESGQVEIEESPFDLHQLIQEIKSLMFGRAHEKGLDFTVEQSLDLPRHVVADAGKLRQVMLNLIGNAIKYTQQGGVTLKIEHWKKAAVPDQSSIFNLQFSVIDTGPGIRPKDREHIFLPFVQLEEHPSTEVGTGLGLAICKQYVELMGGTIQVAGEPGKGSVFLVDLPVVSLPSAAVHAEPRPGRVIGLEDGQPRYRMLIAEDHPDNRLLLRKLLAPLGFELREAVNGEEAVALFTEWRPDLIWMDVRMPIMDGLEATRQIKATVYGNTAKIVAVTAHALEQERREILAAGCDDFIRKPFQEDEIFDALAKHLGIRFVYEEETAAAAAQAQVDRTALADLPAALLSELERALSRIDRDAVDRALAAIRDHDPALADGLAVEVQDLQYGRLLQLVLAASGAPDMEETP